MFTFQSLIRNIDFDKPRVSFREHGFVTSDVAVAEALRKLPTFDRDIWETTNAPAVDMEAITKSLGELPEPEVELPQPVAEVKRRGRPPKAAVVVVEGPRSSELSEKSKE